MESQHPQLDLNDWVGRQETSVDIASVHAIVGLSAVLDSPFSIPENGVTPLFPLGHFLHFTPIARMSELGDDGHPLLGGFMPPIELPRRMWAGSKIRFEQPILAGQRLRRSTRIESITPKEGSTGKLCFVVLEHSIYADGEIALTELQTLVYREAVTIDPQRPSAQRQPRPDAAAPSDWEWLRAERPSETTLFRYSALTFNTHRIHYDLPYATGKEGYPGLVVHGPLLATYLMNAFLLKHGDVRVKSFEFSARAPLFVNELIYLVGRRVQDGLEELAVIGPDGKTTMTAHVEFES